MLLSARPAKQVRQPQAAVDIVGVQSLWSSTGGVTAGKGVCKFNMCHKMANVPMKGPLFFGSARGAGCCRARQLVEAARRLQP